MTTFPIETRHLCDLAVEIAPILDMGRSPRGHRRNIPITGGTVTGARLSGRILNLGADWQTVYADGMAELVARYMIETHDGALIEVNNWGLRCGPPEVIARLAAGEEVDPGAYYMRTQPRFETGDPRYAWLNRIVCAGSGARRADQVLISVHELV